MTDSWKILVTMAAAAVLVQSGFARTEIALDGPGWHLYGLQPGGGERLGIPSSPNGQQGAVSVSVPNDVQLAVLNDPFGQGPEVAAINNKEWWYTRNFSSPKTGPGQQVRLVFDGVDYFAGVWLNGVMLGVSGHQKT